MSVRRPYDPADTLCGSYAPSVGAFRSIAEIGRRTERPGASRRWKKRPRLPRGQKVVGVATDRFERILADPKIFSRGLTTVVLLFVAHLGPLIEGSKASSFNR